MQRIKTVTIDTTNLVGWRKYKAIEASKKVLIFFQSDFFYKKIMEVQLKSLRGESKSSITKRMDNIQLYKHIMSGHEVGYSQPDYNINLVVKWYMKQFSKVVGYIIRNKPTMHVNGKFFDKATIVGVVSNMCHEWMHLLGVFHSGKGEVLRDSLAYLVNKWVEEFYSDPTLQENDRNIEITERPRTETYCTWWGWNIFRLKKTCYTRVK